MTFSTLEKQEMITLQVQNIAEPKKPRVYHSDSLQEIAFLADAMQDKGLESVAYRMYRSPVKVLSVNYKEDNGNGGYRRVSEWWGGNTIDTIRNSKGYLPEWFDLMSESEVDEMRKE